MKTIQGFPVVDEFAPHPDPAVHGRGYEPRDYSAHPLGVGDFCSQYTGPKINPSEFQERIAEKTAKKTWVSDICDSFGSKVKNQSNTNYCWINAPTRGMEICYVVSNGLVLDLSAAHPGSIIQGGRNAGGSGITAVKFMAKYGVPTTKYWATNKISGSADNDSAAVADAARHKILAYTDIDSDDHDAITSMVLSNRAVTVGIPRWGHEVAITFCVWDNGRVIHGIDNSWSPDWGNNGRGLLTGAYANYDEAGSIESVTPASS